MARFNINHKRIGPFRINFRDGMKGISSVSLDLGIPNFVIWSKDGRRGLSSIDTPGFGSIRRDLKTRKQRDAAQAAQAQQQRRRSTIDDDAFAQAVADAER